MGGGPEEGEGAGLPDRAAEILNTKDELREHLRRAVRGPVKHAAPSGQGREVGARSSKSIVVTSIPYHGQEAGSRRQDP